MVPTRPPLWVEWRASKREKYNKNLGDPVKPSQVLRTELCAWCWGQKAIYEAVKVEGKTVGYLPVICSNCDGYGVTA